MRHAKAGKIESWAQAFSEQGDLLIYGCNLASTPEGLGLVNSLARLTGADGGHGYRGIAVWLYGNDCVFAIVTVKCFQFWSLEE